MDKSPHSLYKCASYENQLKNLNSINDDDKIENNSLQMTNFKNNDENQLKTPIDDDKNNFKKDNNQTEIDVNNSNTKYNKNNDLKIDNSKFSIAGVNCSTNASSRYEFVMRDENVNVN